jgi:hypothetical protein
VKTCRKCGETKPREEFNKRGNNGLQSRCRMCDNSQNREWYSKNKDKAKARSIEWSRNNKDKAKKAYRASHLKHNYSLTPNEWDELFDRQGGRCAICGTYETGNTRRFNVDHNHKTNDVRGLLCHHCNTGIGHLKDSPELLYKAAYYLKERGYSGN